MKCSCSGVFDALFLSSACVQPSHQTECSLLQSCMFVTEVLLLFVCFLSVSSLFHHRRSSKHESKGECIILMRHLVCYRKAVDLRKETQLYVLQILLAGLFQINQQEIRKRHGSLCNQTSASVCKDLSLIWFILIRKAERSIGGFILCLNIE